MAAQYTKQHRVVCTREPANQCKSRYEYNNENAVDGDTFFDQVNTRIGNTPQSIYAYEM